MSAPSTDYPLRLGDPETFAAARACFERARFDEPTVARRLGGQTLFGFPRLSDGRRTVAGPVEDANAALIRLLLDGDPLATTLVESLCGEPGVRALRALGVLTSDPADASAIRATVLLAPVGALWIAQDMPPRKARSLDPAVVPRDIVFPALTELTHDFLDTLAAAPGLRVLELCAGTGVAALRAVRGGASEAWATDIAERSVHFARWNAALNDLVHVHVVASDVWDALGGETFDRVFAHPPYVPALAHVFDYRDAGADGEQITRRIVEGLPAHLRPGGRCTLACALTDRRGAPLEARLRGWLGADASDFDLVAVERRSWDALHAYRSVSGRSDGFVGAEAWLTHFQSLGIERFVLGSYELRRRSLGAAGGAPLTERRRSGARLDAAAVDWPFRWAHRLTARMDEAPQRAGRPRVVPGTVVEVTLRAGVTDWRTIGATVRTDYPLLAAVAVPPLAPTLLELCDGTRDAAALLDALRAGALVGDDVTIDDVASLLERLLAVGALELADYPVPRRPPTADPRTSDTPGAEHAPDRQPTLRP